MCIGIQVDEKELIIEKYKESDLQPRMVITKGIIRVSYYML